MRHTRTSTLALILPTMHNCNILRMYHGQGHLSLPNGATYTGGFAAGRYHGKGTPPTLSKHKTNPVQIPVKKFMPIRFPQALSCSLTVSVTKANGLTVCSGGRAKQRGLMAGSKPHRHCIDCPPDVLCGVGTMGSGVTANLTVVVRSRMLMAPRAFYPQFNTAIRFHFLQVCWGVLEGCEARKRAGSAAERPVL